MRGNVCGHVGGVSGSLEQSHALTENGHIQNHGLFAQNRLISDPREFTRNLHKRSH